MFMAASSATRYLNTYVLRPLGEAPSPFDGEEATKTTQNNHHYLGYHHYLSYIYQLGCHIRTAKYVAVDVIFWSLTISLQRQRTLGGGAEGA